MGVCASAPLHECRPLRPAGAHRGPQRLGAPKIAELDNRIVAAGTEERVFELDVTVDHASAVAKVHNTHELLEQTPGLHLGQHTAYKTIIGHRGTSLQKMQPSHRAAWRIRKGHHLQHTPSRCTGACLVLRGTWHVGWQQPKSHRLVRKTR